MVNPACQRVSNGVGDVYSPSEKVYMTSDDEFMRSKSEKLTGIEFNDDSIRELNSIVIDRRINRSLL
jgi:LDH2 family malate/lactate/ureidoglycolate dehydrogenase